MDKPCEYCLRNSDTCICPKVDKFFQEHGHLMERLAELEEREKKQNTDRCVACYFAPCRCRGGRNG